MQLRNWTVGLLVATVVLCGLPARAQSPNGLVPGGAAPDLALVYTGDVIGFLDPCG